MVPIAATAPLINITIRASDDDVCKTKCKYTLWDNNEMSALYYSVFVTAKNILSDGYGEGKTCSNKTISKELVLIILLYM